MRHKSIYLAIMASFLLLFSSVNAQSFSDNIKSIADKAQENVKEKLNSTDIDEKLKAEVEKAMDKFESYIGEGNYEKAKEYLSTVKGYSEKMTSLGIDYGKKVYREMKETYEEKMAERKQKEASEDKNEKESSQKPKESKIKELKIGMKKAMDNFREYIGEGNYKKAKEYLSTIKDYSQKMADAGIDYGKEMYKKFKRVYERKVESQKEKTYEKGKTENIEKAKTTKSGDDDIGNPDKEKVKKAEQDNVNKLKTKASSKSVEKIKEEAQKRDYLSDSMKDKVSSKLNKISDNKKVKYYEKVLDKIQSKRETITEKIEKQQSISERASSNYKRIFGVLNEVEQVIKDKLQKQKEKTDNNIDSMLDGLLEG